MKKQIFIFVLAIFASVTTAFGQAGSAVAGTAPVPLTCPTDALNPIAGRAYNYSAFISPTAGSAFWYATKDTVFTNGGTRVATVLPADGTALASGATNYNTPVTTFNPTDSTKTTVTWTSSVLAGVDKTTHPLFMVLEYTGPSGSGTCANNNIKVMQILPKIAFTVDITNMTHGATQTSIPFTPTPIPTESQCFDMVQSSRFNLATGQVTNDYGTNVLYFEVINANFTGSCKDSLQLTGLQTTQTATIDWGYTKGTYDANAGTDLSGATITTSALNINTTATSTSLGVSIYVRVTVKNHGFEGLANEDLTLAVEATDASGNKDVDPDCVTFTPFGDKALQTLNLRPTVTAGTTQLPQVP